MQPIFICYCLTGERFRNELYRILKIQVIVEWLAKLGKSKKTADNLNTTMPIKKVRSNNIIHDHHTEETGHGHD